MKIQMVTLMAGPQGSLQPGEIADLPTAQAEALIKGGFARPAKEGKAPAPIETGMIKPPETAVLPTASPSGSGPPEGSPQAGPESDESAGSAKPETKAERKAREKAEREAAKAAGKGG